MCQLNSGLADQCRVAGQVLSEDPKSSFTLCSLIVGDEICLVPTVLSVNFILEYVLEGEPGLLLQSLDLADPPGCASWTLSCCAVILDSCIVFSKLC